MDKNNQGRNMPKLNFDNLQNQKQLQDFYRKSIYTKGYSYTTQAGATIAPDISLGGEARKLFGIGVYSNIGNVTDEDRISLLINQEQIIDDVIWWAYNPQPSVGNIANRDQYFSIIRPLSGSDTVKFSVTAANAHKGYIVFYLSNAYD